MKWPHDNLNSQEELKNIRNGEYGESYKILYEHFSNFFSNMFKIHNCIKQQLYYCVYNIMDIIYNLSDNKSTKKAEGNRAVMEQIFCILLELS